MAILVSQLANTGTYALSSNDATNRFIGLSIAESLNFTGSGSLEILDVSNDDSVVLSSLASTGLSIVVNGNVVSLTNGTATKLTLGALIAGESVTVQFSDSQSITISADTNGYSYLPSVANSTAKTITSTPGLLTLDTVAPTVSTISIATATGISNSYLNAGDVVSVTVPFSEAVTVTGTPTLDLVIGSTTVQAAYATGTGTNSLTFTYAILANQTDTDGISIPANALKQVGTSTIKDATGNDAVLTNDEVTANSSYKVDTTAPTAATITSITFTDKNSSSTFDAGDEIQITFAEPVSTALALADLSLSDGTNAHSFGTGASLSAISALNNLASAFKITLGTSPTIATDDTLSVATTKAVDVAGNSNASAITFTVPVVADVTAPTMQSAEVSADGLNVVITYSEALAGTAEAADYAVTLATGTTTVTNAVIGTGADANKVTLTLGNAIGTGVTVSGITYTATAGTANSITDSATNPAQTQTLATGITNDSTADVTPPAFVSATVNGATLVLTYDEALDATNVPATTDFSISVNSGAGATPTGVTVDSAAKTVTLTLASAVTQGQTVTVTYTDPTTGNDTNAIQDTAGNDATTLTNQTVENLTAPSDSTAPVISDARIVRGAADTLLITLTEDSALQGEPTASNFVVNVNNGSATTQATYDATTPITYNTTAKTITLKLASGVAATDTITLTYNQPNDTNAAQRITDTAGNMLANVTARAVSNALEKPLTTTVVDSVNFVENDAVDNSRYIKLVGMDFVKLLDIGKGESVADKPDIKARLDWGTTGSEKLVWNVVGDSTTSVKVTAADVASANVISNTELRVVLTETAWNTLKGTTGILGFDSAIQDDVTVAAGFLKDFAGNISNDTLSSSEGKFTGEYNATMPAETTALDPYVPTIYSSIINLSGDGFFSGTNVQNDKSTLKLNGLEAGQTLSVSNLGKFGSGTIENNNITGEIIASLGTTAGITVKGSSSAGATTTAKFEMTTNPDDAGVDPQQFSVSTGVDIFVIANPSSLPLVADGSTFDVTKDKVLLVQSSFSALGASAGQITGFETILTYDSDTGVLYYDADGSGENAPVGIMLIGIGLTNLLSTNFELI